jgi:hypothetical protein
MRTYRSKHVSLSERPYYADDEIELICSDELRAVGLLPVSPEPIRIERFIEKRFGISPQYDDLGLGHGVLGFTKFGPKGVQAIVVSRTLSEEGTRVSERRLNTTLAHEGGHGLLHAHLFVLGQPAPSLFEQDDSRSDPMRILCREDTVFDMHRSGQKRYTGRWWEFQANRAIGALLLPKQLVGQCLEEVLVVRGTFEGSVLPQERREHAIRLLSDVFDVNPVVARIRVEALYPASQAAQLTL